MPVTVRNLTRWPLLFNGSSGVTVRLSPGQTSDELPDVEIMNNPKIDRLRRDNAIEITQSQTPTPPSAPAAAETAAEDTGAGSSSAKKRGGSAG